MVAKQYIYSCRCLKKRLNINEFDYEIEIIRKTELKEAIKRCKTFIYNKKWYDNVQLDEHLN